MDSVVALKYHGLATVKQHHDGMVYHNNQSPMIMVVVVRQQRRMEIRSCPNPPRPIALFCHGLMLLWSKRTETAFRFVWYGQFYPAM